MKKNKNIVCYTTLGIKVVYMLVLTMLITMLAGCNSQNVTPEVIAEEDTEFFYSDGIDENGFFEGIKALDYVEIFQYKGLIIPSNIHQISEDYLQSEIDNILDYFSYDEQNKIMDRAVVDGDTVNIDYVGSVDGVEFENGSTLGEGTDVTIGVTSYIDDFLEQLIGCMPGETINVEVTFPDVYQEASLQGKDAVFVTTVNYIVENVGTVQPELTDDFVASNLYDYYEWKTVADMKEGLAAELRNEAIQQYISDYMINEVNIISIPDVISEYQVKAMMEYYQYNAEMYGVEFKEFLNSYVGVSDEAELIELNRENNQQNAVYTLVSQAVAEDADILASEDDMIKYLPDYSQYEAEYGLPYLKQFALFQKVYDYIIDNAVFE